MEKILAIETSGRTFGLALAEYPCSSAAVEGSIPETGIRAEFFLDAGLRHSEILMDTCRDLLEKCGWRNEDLTAIAVSTGPGSFTGLRVGISFCRALAQALDIPLIGIPAFEILAKEIQMTSSSRSPLLCILIDSIGNEVYTGLFSSGKTQPLEKYSVCSVPQLCARIEGLHHRGKLVFAGDGFRRYAKEIRKRLGDRVEAVSYDQNVPHARYCAQMALKKLKKTKFPKKSWEKIVPFYLRPPMAVERLKNPPVSPFRKGGLGTGS